MKKLYVVMLALGAGVLAGCKKEKNGPLDPSAMLALNAPKEVQANEAATKAADGEQQRLTPRQVIERATLLTYYPLGQSKRSLPAMGMLEDRKDFVNNRIILPSVYVINERGRLDIEFIDGSEFLLLEEKEIPDGWTCPPGTPFVGLDHICVDTVGYIPSRIIQEASAKIKAAYARGDYDACYKLFEEAYVFYPITGRELKELQERGEE